jgi:hypothetical protein
MPFAEIWIAVGVHDHATQAATFHQHEGVARAFGIAEHQPARIPWSPAGCVLRIIGKFIVNGPSFVEL